MVSTRLRAAALLVVGLALTGCSGASGDTDAAATETPAASATPDASSTAPATSPSSSATDAAGSAGGSTDAAGAQFCADRAELTALGSQMQQAGVQSLFDELPTYVQKLDAMQPPEAVATDFATYRDGWHAVSDATAGESATSPTLQAKVTAAIAAHPGVQTAEGNLKAWTDANCPAASATPAAG